MAVGAGNGLVIETGDILITTELTTLRLGQINKIHIENDILFDLPHGFLRTAEAILEPYHKAFTLNEYMGANGQILPGVDGESFDLSQKIEISRSGFEMQWYVRNADPKHDLYDLIAIGTGRTVRMNDWKDIASVYLQIPSMQEEIPELKDFIFVNGVDSSFFEKKAVFKTTAYNGKERFNASIAHHLVPQWGRKEN